MVSRFVEHYGPWAVVCGASEGLGAEFGRQLAARGLNVVLVARRAEALEQVKAEVLASSKVEVRCVTADLASSTVGELIGKATEGLEVGLLVYNAALSPVGPFLEQTLEENLKAIDVNVRGPVTFAHRFAPAMVTRGRGSLVLLSSLTAFQGSPFVSTYGATKAFNLALAEGLWFELAKQGVDVLAVCAGATRTPNFVKAAPDGAPGLLEPSAVVTDALSHLHHGPLTIPGLFNRVASFFMRRLLPRKTTIAIMGQQTRKLQTKA